MSKILITNSNNTFGKNLINKLLEIKSNKLIVAISNCDKYVKDTNIEYIVNKFNKTTDNMVLLQNIREMENIIKYTNEKYNGIDICIDCTEKSEDLNITEVLLAQSIANNISKNKILSSIKIISNNSITIDYLNKNFKASKIEAFNCDTNVENTIDIINGQWKFSTKTKIPYFDFDTYEGKYSPLLYF